MVRLILVISLFICTNAAKEALDNLDQLLDDPNIWQYIEKRVGQKENTEKDKNDDNLAEVPPFHSSNPRLQRPNSNDFKDGNPNRPSFYNKEQESQVSNEKKEPEPVKTTPQSFAKTISDSSGNECSFRQNSSTIIRSQRSLANGAAFLKSAFHMSSDECATKCCYTQNCNLAVYEEKDEHSCYLFDCGSPSRCEFAMHGHYTVLSFHETSGRTGIQQQHHESELENLGKTPVPVKPTTTPAPVKDTVPLYGDCDIDWGQTCADRNTECRDEQCKCKEGYHAIYAYCRKVCKSDEFQCKNKGQDDTVPDCIDKEHRCDGVPQCADGSDEEECSTETKDNKDSPSLGMTSDTKGIQNKSKEPVIPKANKPLPTNTDKLSKHINNQFYGQLPDKQTYVNPGPYGNNPMIPQQLQDYYWPPQHPQYQPSYPDYPQYQGQQGQGYFNNLGYGGQKYINPFRQGVKSDSSNLNSGYLGGYPANQNVPLNKYPVNQIYDKSMENGMNSNYQDQLKPSYAGLNPYPDNNVQNNSNKSTTQTTVSSSTSTSTTTTTMSTTTTTTTTTTTPPPVVITTRKTLHNDAYMDEDYYPDWSRNNKHRSHQKSDQQNREPFRSDTGSKHNYNTKNRNHKSKVNDEDRYHERYPYRFRQNPEYDDRVRWPEYYDEYPDIRPGKKIDLYDNIFDGGSHHKHKGSSHHHKDKDSDMRRPDKPANSHTQDNTPAPQSVVIPQEVNQGETNNDQLKDQSKEQEAKEPIEEAKSEESKEPDSGNQESKEEKQEIKSTTVQPTTKVPKTTAKSLNLAGPDKVLIKSPTDSNQGPIVALALGLGICLMLLIFVGCRLRTVKRRIRRGKSLHSNEADYLINGMYL